MDIITGERIQELCDIYIGEQSDFDYNPRIAHKKQKHLTLQNIPYNYDNPKYIFVYAHRLTQFSYYLDSFMNPFILVTHNSDENITEKYIHIAEHEKVQSWFAQNVMIEHPKVNILPIGVANSMWPHGSTEIIERYAKNLAAEQQRTNNFYFSFNNTNDNVRTYCKEVLSQKGLLFTEPVPFEEYIINLCNTKYCICPEGNGIDTHRFWEALYCGCIPIVLKNKLTEKLVKKFPCIVFNSWQELDIEQLSNKNYNILPVRKQITMNAVKQSLNNY